MASSKNGSGNSGKVPAAKTAARKTASKGTSSKKTGKVILPWNFPRNTLESCVSLVHEIDEKYAGKPTPAEEVAALAGFNRSADWRFQELLRSAQKYGLTTGSGATAVISLTQLAEDIVAPSSPLERKRAIRDAFENVELFEKVSEFYRSKRIPDDEFFANTLVRQFGVPKDQVGTFIEVYTANFSYLAAYGAVGRVEAERPAQVEIASTNGSVEFLTKEENEVKSVPERQFLESCFIIMPFGKWYNKYYEEIYIPATQEAGFDPIRADSIFTTGSVTEQIWEQIRKAKVLLADLTGRNPNVFYELGLAHALPKPVVLVAETLDDVPFDLRHLRTIIYKVRDPDWGAKLRKNITAHLRSAKSDPEKSIPQPFRDGWKKAGDAPAEEPKDGIVSKAV